jgi:putative transposase
MANIRVIQPNQNQTVIENPVVCKYCNSNAVVKFGTYEGIQRYWCKVCQRKFRANDELYQMKTPANQVSSAVGMYYEGMSLNGIRRHLQQEYGNYPSSKSVYGWIQKYTDEAINQFKDYHPNVGDTWVADETVVKLDGKNVWCIDIIDKDTRYLLATKLSPNREKNDIKILMERARDRTGKTPKRILTDGWKGYLDGIELAYGADSKHIQTDPFNEYDNTELIERWHGTLKSRTKVMRGLKSVETANKFLDGYLVHYNYLRPHESLNGKTPAEVAKVQYTSKSWVDITRMAKPHIEVLTTPTNISVLSEKEPFVRPTAHRRYNIDLKRKQRKTRRQLSRRKGVFTNKAGTILTRRDFRGARKIG